MKLLRAIAALGAAVSAASASAQTLNVSSWTPASQPLVRDMVLPWCKDIETGSQGKLKCHLLPKAVIGALQTLDGIRDGLADVSFTVHGYTAGRFPMAKAAEFAFMGDKAEHMSVAWHRIYASRLAQADGDNGVVNLAVFTHGPGHLHNAKRAVRSVADLAGLKMRTGGGVVVDTTKALGMVPLLRPSPETYEMMSSGIADGALFPHDGVGSFKLEKLVRHTTVVPGGLYNISFTLIMNPATYKKLGKAEQDVIQRYSGEAYARRAGKAWDASDAHALEVMRAAGVNIQTADDALIREIRARTEPLEKEWIEKEAKSRGVDGAAVLEALRAEIRNVAAAR